VRLLLLLFFMLAALSVILSGVMALLARSKLPNAPRRSLLVSGLFRIGVGLAVLVVLLRGY
jgi:hypothetical protein